MQWLEDELPNPIMLNIASIKESVFGVFSILNESSARSNAGEWNTRLIRLSYFIDAGQAHEPKFAFPLFVLCYLNQLFTQVLRALISSRYPHIETQEHNLFYDILV